MHQHIDSWKNSSTAFEQQLDRNIQELNGQFPPHWVHFINHVKNNPVNRIVDVGCGAGVYCHLAEQMGLDYIGYDYSQHAVDLAIKTWGDKFVCKNYQGLTPEDIKVDDLIVANALCDVLPNGHHCLQPLMSLEGQCILMQRVRITSLPSFSMQYKAYDITTYEYYHNTTDLSTAISSHGYNVTYHRLYDEIFDLEIQKW